MDRAIFLDSNKTQANGRFDIFTAAPSEYAQLNTLEHDLNISNTILDFEERIKNNYLDSISRNNTSNTLDQLPFVCGLMGYCSYDLGEYLQIKKKTDSIKNNQLASFPKLFIGFYTWSYVFDHQANLGTLTFSPFCSDELRQKIIKIIETSQQKPSLTGTPLNDLQWHKAQSRENYSKRFQTVKDYIRNGDCYQINLTQLLTTVTNESGPKHYFASRKVIQTPFSCLIHFNQEQQLLCFSPEQFIKINKRTIESRPIKGTIVNNGDETKLNALQESAKNKAENIMIVDLLRNDLGKVCQAHSVHVPALLKIESFQNVHHLVSTIRGKLKPDISELGAFLSCFPGGSITGAPKVRAMEIIDELEPTERSAYCGSVFYLNHLLNFDSNILIRSVVKNNSQLFCWGGGGIVADSEAEDEYLESLLKVANLTGITD